jgi:hypothetical protein
MVYCRAAYTTGESMDVATLPENGWVGTTSIDEIICIWLCHGKATLCVTLEQVRISVHEFWMKYTASVVSYWAWGICFAEGQYFDSEVAAWKLMNPVHNFYFHTRRRGWLNILKLIFQRCIWNSLQCLVVLQSLFSEGNVYNRNSIPVICTGYQECINYNNRFIKWVLLKCVRHSIQVY